MIGQEPTYWSKARRTFEECAWSFWTYQWLFAWNYNWKCSSDYSVTHDLQSTLEASGIEWPALRNHIPWMAHIIQLASGAFMSSLRVKGRNKSWDAPEHNQQLGENESVDIRKSQRCRTECNAWINKVSAMRSGLALIIETVCISWYFETSETDLRMAENTCCIDSADTWSRKWVHRLSKPESPHFSTSDYGCEDTLELNTGVDQVSQLITGIHMRVPPKSTIHRLWATFHNSGWMDHCEEYHGSIKAISILDPVDVEVTYSQIASYYRNVQWHVRSYGCRDASFGWEDDSVEGGLVLRCELNSTEAVEIPPWSDFNGRNGSHCWTYARSFPEVAIV